MITRKQGGKRRMGPHPRDTEGPKVAGTGAYAAACVKTPGGVRPRNANAPFAPNGRTRESFAVHVRMREQESRRAPLEETSWRQKKQLAPKQHETAPASLATLALSAVTTSDQRSRAVLRLQRSMNIGKMHFSARLSTRSTSASHIQTSERNRKVEHVVRGNFALEIDDG